MGNTGFSVSKVIAVLLWVTTLVVGLLDIYVFQFITIWFYANFFNSGTQASAVDIAASNSLRITTVLIVGVLYVIFLIATSEYHFKHLAQPSSWRLLGWSIVIELLIIIIAAIMGPITW